MIRRDKTKVGDEVRVYPRFREEEPDFYGAKGTIVGIDDSGLYKVEVKRTLWLSASDLRREV
jgi:hypothetical protein